MADQIFLIDDQFDALVDRLHALNGASRIGAVDRWEIRVALAEYGVLPRRVAPPPPAPAPEESLADSLRAVLRQLRPVQIAEVA